MAILLVDLALTGLFFRVEEALGHLIFIFRNLLGVFRALFSRAILFDDLEVTGLFVKVEEALGLFGVLRAPLSRAILLADLEETGLFFRGEKALFRTFDLYLERPLRIF